MILDNIAFHSAINIYWIIHHCFFFLFVIGGSALSSSFIPLFRLFRSFFLDNLSHYRDVDLITFESKYNSVYFTEFLQTMSVSINLCARCCCFSIRSSLSFHYTDEILDELISQQDNIHWYSHSQWPVILIVDVTSVFTWNALVQFVVIQYALESDPNWIGAWCSAHRSIQFESKGFERENAYQSEGFYCETI